ncbi:TPA: FaeA/PapI family transcriptional regulator [Serratia marcescens]
MSSNIDAHFLLQVLNQLLKSDDSDLCEKKILPIEDWPTTRKVADAAGVSIYKARATLLAMHAKGLVLVSREVKKKNLLWYPLLAHSEQPKAMSPFVTDVVNRFIKNDKIVIWRFK